MTIETLPLTSIIVSDRQRLDLGDIPDLADSLKRFGLIEPIIIDDSNHLIAGGRRFAAATLLQWPTIPCVRRSTLSQPEHLELELEENIRRKDMSWQERALAIANIHIRRQAENNYDTSKWGLKQTGALLNVDFASISLVLKVSALLKAELFPNGTPKPDARFWPCNSMAEALRLRLRDQEDAAMKSLSNISSITFDYSLTNSSASSDPLNPIDSDSPDKEAERVQYESNPLNTLPFDDYYKEKQALDQATTPTVYLSRMLHNCDSISFMHSNPNRFDHIITDIPYAIDMDNLNQQNPHGGFVDLDTVEKEHDVDYNLKLISDFFPAAFACTKPHAFVITWCDQMLWQYMYDLAVKAGFAVQRWPITWIKTSLCLNQCANFNFTKNTEIAIVCRKPGTTLFQSDSSSTIVSGKDDLCEKINHKFAKPFACWQKLIEPCTLTGQLILEPFAGRGSGVISNLMLNRNVIACELQENHFNYLQENVRSYFRSISPKAQFK